jgi:hypothetical protein
MQDLLVVLFSIDETRRYVRDGRPEQLRLALVLLDNAIELQLERRVRQELQYELEYDQLQRIASQIPSGEHSNFLSEVIDRVPLTLSQKRSIGRLFDEKLRYLTDRARARLTLRSLMH